MKFELVSKSNPDIKFKLDESFKADTPEGFITYILENLSKKSDFEIVVTY